MPKSKTYRRSNMIRHNKSVKKGMPPLHRRETTSLNGTQVILKFLARGSDVVAGGARIALHCMAHNRM